MSASSPSHGDLPGDLRCPSCGAALIHDATACWLCFADLGPPATPSPARWPAARAPAPATPAPREVAPVGGFSLASLLLFITLLCVVFGVGSLWPGLAVPLGAIALIAWIRTAAATRQRARSGQAVTGLEKAQLFAASIGSAIAMIILVFAAGFAALVVACFVCISAMSAL